MLYGSNDDYQQRLFDAEHSVEKPPNTLPGDLFVIPVDVFYEQIVKFFQLRDLLTLMQTDKSLKQICESFPLEKHQLRPCIDKMIKMGVKPYPFNKLDFLYQAYEHSLLPLTDHWVQIVDQNGRQTYQMMSLADMYERPPEKSKYFVSQNKVGCQNRYDTDKLMDFIKYRFFAPIIEHNGNNPDMMRRSQDALMMSPALALAFHKFLNARLCEVNQGRHHVKFDQSKQRCQLIGSYLFLLSTITTMALLAGACLDYLPSHISDQNHEIKASALQHFGMILLPVFLMSLTCSIPFLVDDAVSLGKSTYSHFNNKQKCQALERQCDQLLTGPIHQFLRQRQSLHRLDKHDPQECLAYKIEKAHRLDNTDRDCEDEGAIRPFFARR